MDAGRLAGLSLVAAVMVQSGLCWPWHCQTLQPAVAPSSVAAAAAVSALQGVFAEACISSREASQAHSVALGGGVCLGGQWASHWLGFANVLHSVACNKNNRLRAWSVPGIDILPVQVCSRLNRREKCWKREEYH